MGFKVELAIERTVMLRRPSQVFPTLCFSKKLAKEMCMLSAGRLGRPAKFDCPVQAAMSDEMRMSAGRHARRNVRAPVSYTPLTLPTKKTQ